MEKIKPNSFLEKNTLFGIFVGLGFIIASYLFFRTGRSISLEPHLNNIIMLLSIAGSFIGVRKYRDEVLGGYIKYGKALGACVYLITVASVLYGFFMYYLYKQHPELLENYITTVSLTLQEVYANSPLLENMESMVRTFTTPATIALAEIFNKIFTGFIFSLFLAGLIRRNAR